LTICVSHSTATGRIAGVLRALDQQTNTEFSVVAVDCTNSIHSAANFTALAEQYRRKTWVFRREPQISKAHAIALSVANATSTSLMFLDTDDAPDPNLVERAMAAAEVSGDDLLEVWSRELPSDSRFVEESVQSDSGSPDVAIRASYGIDLVNA